MKKLTVSILLLAACCGLGGCKSIDDVEVEESEIDFVAQEPPDKEWTLKFEGEDVRDISMYPHEWVQFVASLSGNGYLSSTVF